MVFALIPLIGEGERFVGFPNLQRPSTDPNTNYETLQIEPGDVVFWESGLEHEYIKFTSDKGGPFLLVAYRR